MISFKPIENQSSCLDWSKWKEYKANFSLKFYNSSLEITGYKIFINKNSIFNFFFHYFVKML
jgi:hypothetical protein